MVYPVPNATDLGQKFASEIQGKTILITGPSPQSIAAQFAIAIAPHGPKLLILAGRSASKMDAIAEEIKSVAPSCPTRNLIVDFGSLASVRKASQEVNAYSEDIDVAMLSAGVMAPPYSKTEDGFESQFAINHLGHFLFTNNIMSKLQAAAKKNAGGARVVAVSSDGHAMSGIGETIDEINYQDGKTYNQWIAYGQSKSANCLFAVSLSDKLSSKHNVQAFSLHPGVIMSTSLGTGKSNEEWADCMRIREEIRASATQARRQVSTNDFTRMEQTEFRPVTADQGASTLVVAGFDPSIKGETGSYLQDAEVGRHGVEDHAVDPQEAARLWDLSEKLVGQSFLY